MNKKEYIQPSVKVLNIDSCDIVCVSSRSVNISNANPEEDDDFLFATDGNGYVWGE